MRRRQRIIIKTHPGGSWGRNGGSHGVYNCKGIIYNDYPNPLYLCCVEMAYKHPGTICRADQGPRDVVRNEAEVEEIMLCRAQECSSHEVPRGVLRRSKVELEEVALSRAQECSDKLPHSRTRKEA